MTPAEFRVLRKTLGLTAQDIADRFEVNLRTAQRWEATHNPPLDVAEWIEDRVGFYADRVADVLDIADESGSARLLKYRDDAACVERTGLSVSEHDALLGHICIALTAADMQFEITEV